MGRSERRKSRNTEDGNLGKRNQTREQMVTRAEDQKIALG